MKSIQKYVCDLCGLEFTTEAECEAHEKAHAVFETTEPIYGQHTCGRPMTIQAFTADGDAYLYRLEEINGFSVYSDGTTSEDTKEDNDE